MQRAVVAIWLIAVVAGPCLAQAPPLSDTAPTPPDCSDVNTALKPSACACPQGPRIWGAADYLMWWVQNGPTPPLVVTGPAGDAFPGALDQPGTRVLFGDQGLHYGMLNGLRLQLGAWLNPERTLGVEAGGFALQQGSAGFSAQGNANGQPFLATPFVNALTGNQNVYFISQNLANRSAFLTGATDAASATNLWNWEVQGVANLARTSAFSADLLAGFRETSLREDLTYTTSVTNLNAAGASVFLTKPVPPGFQVNTFDKFSTNNLFNGGQAGLRLSGVWGMFGLDVLGKLALGDMHESVAIAGLTTTNAPFPVTQAVGGIYAQPSNIGVYHRDVVAIIPEVGLNASVALTSNIRFRAGYTFLYLSDVVRPGAQVDPVLNIHQVPIDFTYGTPGGPNRPAFEMHGSGFWAQGINLGLEFRF